MDLRFVEKARLEPGKVMLYRAHKDVHLQLPADELSISLNIGERPHDSAFRDQYQFDVDNGKVVDIMQLAGASLEPLLAMAAHFGGEEGAGLIGEFAARHPSDRVRWNAIRTLAGSAKTLDERIAAYEAAARNESRLIASMAAREAASLQASRGWIEKAPAV